MYKNGGAARDPRLMQYKRKKSTSDHSSLHCLNHGVCAVHACMFLDLPAGGLAARPCQNGAIAVAKADHRHRPRADNLVLVKYGFSAFSVPRFFVV